MLMRKRQDVPVALTVAACGVLVGCASAHRDSLDGACGMPTALAACSARGRATACAAGKGVPLPSAGSENTGYQDLHSGPPPFALAGDTVCTTTGKSVKS